jgi:hypothetical protein
MIFPNKGESLLQLRKRTTGAGLLEVKRVPANKPAASEAPAPSKDATGSISGMPHLTAASPHCCPISLLPHLIAAASPHCCLISLLLPHLTAASSHCCLISLLPQFSNSLSPQAASALHGAATSAGSQQQALLRKTVRCWMRRRGRLAGAAAFHTKRRYLLTQFRLFLYIVTLFDLYYTGGSIGDVRGVGLLREGSEISYRKLGVLL